MVHNSESIQAEKVVQFCAKQFYKDMLVAGRMFPDHVGARQYNGTSLESGYSHTEQLFISLERALRCCYRSSC